MHDEGFNLPDTRRILATVDGGSVYINILRHWYQGDEPDDEPRFHVSWRIDFRKPGAGSTVTDLPTGISESQAEEIARILYKIDDDATAELDEIRAIEAAERRAGC